MGQIEGNVFAEAALGPNAPCSSRRSACGSSALERPRSACLAVKRLQRLAIEVEVAVNASEHVIEGDVFGLLAVLKVGSSVGPNW
jgi:hypothetical protein